MSSFQFKHLDKNQNWYRRGELTLAQRMPQVLSIQPTFLQILTWNDSGESTYIGNVWPESMPAAYSNNFDHTGWQILLAPFISAYKSGATNVSEIVPLNGTDIAGSFWYRTLLTSATCASDPLGKPVNWETAEDVVNVAVLLSEAASGATINVYSGSCLIGSRIGVRGLNAWSMPGLKVGAVAVEVIGSDGSVLSSARSIMDVAADAAVCHYNYQVVALK
jgi:glucan endo-1,3-alpha-glucosidase